MGATALLAAGGCAVGGTGTRDEGPARPESAARVSPAPSASERASVPVMSQQTVVRLLLSDASVSAETKKDLKPCGGHEYPVDVSSGDLTGAGAPDLLVNVMTCGDAVGVASYVYRKEKSGYVSVFRAEDPPVYAEIDRGDLVVTRQLYKKGDPVSYPSSEEVITYGWHGGEFSESYRMRNDYSKAVGGDNGDNGTGEDDGVAVPTTPPG
ncbi:MULTISPECIES: hypothetical protein [unclassified Streptomyces]|uniref:hypothetical protein n=1 Tax=unclassified Streptomyces TaxID=2593676 RepID=UPI0004CB0E4F|nr:hypothetical protein [Streptomyces sp. NRRL F-5630]